MADDDIEEVEDEWDETLIEMRRFAIEQSVLMRAPSDKMTDVFERADRILEYLANGN
jgi:hypothetical protein